MAHKLNEKDSAVRQAILDTASELFYAQGIRAIGVDTIVAKSGVAKASLYRWFPSKDHLIESYLQNIYESFWQWWDKQLEKHAAPEQQLRAVLRGIVRLLDRTDFRGCPSINATSELADPEHPGRRQSRANKTEMRRRLLVLCRALGIRQPRVLADQIMLLIDGAFASAHVLGSDGAHHELVSAAMSLVQVHR